MRIYGSKMQAVLVLGLIMGVVNAQDDPSQRPLPLPENGVADLPQHMELLKRLRSLVESQQKNSTKPNDESDASPSLPELPSPADSNSTPPRPNQATPKTSPFHPQQLQQLQDALKNLAGSLPPGFVPPDLSSVPPDQLRKAMENPAVQQQMKQLLEQFAKDGVLPKQGANGSQLPVPQRDDDRPNDSSQESLRKDDAQDDELSDTAQPKTQEKQNKSFQDAPRDSAEADRSPDVRPPRPSGQNPSDNDESSAGESAANDTESPATGNDAPPGSIRSLRSFLKRLAEDTGMKAPEPSSNSAPNSNSAPKNSPQDKPATSFPNEDPASVSEPKSLSDSSTVPSTRRPLRKRDSVKPKTSPLVDSSDTPAPDASNNSSERFPEPFPQPLNRPNAFPEGNIPENSPASDSLNGNPAVPDSALPNPPQGLKINPESARKQLEELQKTIERMKQLAEESEPAVTPPEEQPSPDSRINRSGARDDQRSSDSNSIVPSTGRNNRMANRPDSDNINGDQLPEALPNVDEFLREQLKSFKLSPDAAPGDNSVNERADRSLSSGTNPLANSREANPNQRFDQRRLPIDSIPRDLSMERPLQPDEIQRLRDRLRSENAGRSNTNPSATGTAESEKPTIDIAKELEQRGFGNTLKQLVERAKEEAKKPRQPQQNPADTQEIAGNSPATPSDIEKAIKDATGAAKKTDPELSDSVAKMLDGLKDDLVEIAKDARFKDPPERSRGNRSVNRTSPAESNSMIDTFRKSASEILAGPSRSPDSGNSAASGASSAAANAFSGEFDFTPVLVLAGVLAALAIAFFGLRHFKLGGNEAAEFQFAGPPLKPDDITSRADVVRAFHEFALRSAQSVQSWWTHRTVQQAILEKAPEYRAAVETLANTYEQARYLPVEQELSAEQLESARSALQQCAGQPKR